MQKKHVQMIKTLARVDCFTVSLFL